MVFFFLHHMFCDFFFYGAITQLSLSCKLLRLSSQLNIVKRRHKDDDDDSNDKNRFLVEYTARKELCII